MHPPSVLCCNVKHFIKTLNSSKGYNLWSIVNTGFFRVMCVCVCVCVVCVCACALSPVWLFTMPWTLACQAPLSMGFSRQEYWSGLPCPPPGDLPNPGMEPRSHVSCISRGFFISSVTWKVPTPRIVIFKLQKIKDKQRILMELQEKKKSYL